MFFHFTFICSGIYLDFSVCHHCAFAHTIQNIANMELICCFFVTLEPFGWLFLKVVLTQGRSFQVVCFWLQINLGGFGMCPSRCRSFQVIYCLQFVVSGCFLLIAGCFWLFQILPCFTDQDLTMVYLNSATSQLLHFHLMFVRHRIGCFSIEKNWNEVEFQLLERLRTWLILINREDKYMHSNFKTWKELIQINFHGQDIPCNMYCKKTAV